jgi:histidyl-tRNA synthetase
MSDKKKPAALKARLPRGFVDRTAAELRGVDGMLATIEQVYERYGFEPVETPLVEYTDALGKFLPDQDRPNEGVFSFQDDDEQWLSLRYDLTAPLARYVAENFDALPKPYRSYRCGWVFRNEKPGPGRFRQFMQFDADTVGAASVAADAEMCMMAADAMEALGLKRGDYVVKVNNRKVLDGAMEAIGLGGGENAGRRLAVLRAIDKLDKFGVDGVRQLLGAGRKDESGDFTQGAGLGKQEIEKILVFAILQSGLTPLEDVTNLTADEAAMRGRVHTFRSVPDDGEPSLFVESQKDVLDGLDHHFGRYSSSREGISELRDIERLVSAAGYGRDRIRIDPSVVRGLEYYTGPVYEVELTFPVTNEDGQVVRFGSVAGGGRYDGLVGRFRPEPVPATGFSIGVSRLAEALRQKGLLEGAEARGPVVVLVMDRDRLADHQALAAQLRQAGIAAEMYLGSAGMKPQMKYADRRNAPCVVIQGSDERARSVVQIKDLVEGAAKAAAIASNQEWRESRPGQFECPVGDMVAKVREVLARHA